MKQELKNKITVDFPTLVGDQLAFACGDGWFDILHRLLMAIQRIKASDELRVVTVKQKYGGLNVFVTPWHEEIAHLCHEAERASYSVCEQCGATAGVRFIVVNGWEQVACYPCRQMLKAGWHSGCAEFSDGEKLAVRAALERLIATATDEITRKFPGCRYRVVLRSDKSSHVAVVDAEGRSFAV